jgi:hypothetical protein
MKRLSRHTVVVLLIVVLSSAGGSALAVVAFGQGDGGAPTSGYTATTSTSGTTELSPYATTPSTTPVVTTPTKTSTTPSEATTTNGANPERKHGTTVPSNHGGPPPSRATRKGPSHLAFTGGEPIYVGFFGAVLMVGGLMLHRRRRAATDR